MQGASQPGRGGSLSGILFTPEYGRRHLTDAENFITDATRPPDGKHCVHDDNFWLRSSTPLACGEGGLSVAVDGSIYNRSDLAARLGIVSPASQASLVLQAYQQWGANCCQYLHGDWSIVIWDRARQQLTIARDHLGNSALYYYESERSLAFSTSRAALGDLGVPSPEIDELTLAQHLISWPAYNTAISFDKSVKHLLPAHCIIARPGGLSLRKYWSLEDTKLQRFKSRHDYAEGFRDIFTHVVGERLSAARSAGAMLSGGLDSGSVTAVAASILRQEGRSLDAYTSTPLPEARLHAEGRFGNELNYAQTLAEHAGNVLHHRIACAGSSPVRALRESLEIHCEPMHGSSNMFWMLDLFRQSAANGNQMILTGQMGNGGISWTGDLFSQPLSYQIRELGMREWAVRRLKRSVPGVLARPLRRLRSKPDWRRAAISPGFASRLNLSARRSADPSENPYRSAREMRHYILKPGTLIGGGYYHALGKALGITITDPTADARVLEYCLSVPDAVFLDPETGLDRWLIRQAMKGILPDPIRLNRMRGRQAADLLTRLRAHPSDMEEALHELSEGASRAYLNLPLMRTVWHSVKSEGSQDLFNLGATVLMRGIMAGLFVNRLTSQA